MVSGALVPACNAAKGADPILMGIPAPGRRYSATVVAGARPSPKLKIRTLIWTEAPAAGWIVHAAGVPRQGSATSCQLGCCAPRTLPTASAHPPVFAPAFVA